MMVGLADREPDIAAFSLVELAERVERDEATVLNIELPGPMLALHVSDVGRPAIRHHP
jgi:hypothetical protein